MSNNEAPHHSEPQKLPKQLYIRIQNFTLESGSVIDEAVVAASFRGLLNARRDNAILICHPLSGSAAVEDWWSPLLQRSDPALDSNKYCLICCNSLGSPYGSASPLTYPSDSRRGCMPYGSAFPKTTIRDDVRIHKAVLDILGVRSIHCVIGEGMGGMLALEWAFFGQKYVRAVVLIATAARRPSWTDEQQESTAVHDKEVCWDFCNEDGTARANGDLSAPTITPLGANRTARRLAERVEKFLHDGATHLLGLPPSNKRKVLARRPSLPVVPPCMVVNNIREERRSSNPEQVYAHLAAELNTSSDDTCFRHMMDKIESHDVTRSRVSSNASSHDEALKEVLGQIQQPTLTVEVPTDLLCPLGDQMKLSQNIPRVISATVDRDEDRDGSPIEAERLDGLLHEFLNTINVSD